MGNELINNLIRESIKENWDAYTEESSENRVDYILTGSPWQPRHFEELGQSVIMIKDILKKLAMAGFRNVTTHSIKMEKDSFLIEYNGPENATYHYIGVLIQGSDGVMLVDVPIDVEQMILKVSMQQWNNMKGLGIKNKCGRYKVNGHPWTEGDPVKIRILLSNWQLELRKMGYQMVCVCNVWSQDTWILRKTTSKVGLSQLNIGAGLIGSEMDLTKSRPGSVDSLSLSPKKSGFKLEKINKAVILGGLSNLEATRRSNSTKSRSSNEDSLNVRSNSIKSKLYNAEYDDESVALSKIKAALIKEPDLLCSISFIGTDTLWIVGFPVSVRTQLRLDITAAWRPGVTSDVDACLKLNGSPWSLNDQDISGFLLFFEVIKSMYKLNFRPLQTTNITKKYKDILLFQRSGSLPISIPKMFAIIFYGSDKMIFHDTPKRIIEAIRKAIAADWFGIQQEKEINGIYEIKLHGNPFGLDFNERIQYVLTQMLLAVEENNFSLLLSVDIIGQDTWVFQEKADQ